MLETQRQMAYVLPHKLFDVDNTLYTQHNGIPPKLSREFVPYYDPEVLDKYFDDAGHVIFQNPVNLYDLPIQDIVPTLQVDLEDFYDFVTENLKQGHDGEFNCHRWPHIQRVAQTADELAHGIGFYEEQRKHLLIAAGLHDIGNSGAREDHDRLGALLAPVMYPALGQDATKANIISSSIYWHNEGPYRSIRNYNNAPAEVRQRTLQNLHISPISALLFMADKADIDPSRVEQNRLSVEGIEGHVHSRANLYTRSRGFNVQEDSIDWVVEFDPRVPRDIPDRDYSALTEETADGPMLMGSPSARYNPEDPHSDVDPMKVWKEQWSLYGPKAPMEASRITGMADMALLFKPEFDIRFVDARSGDTLAHHSFSVENMDEEIARIIA